MSTLIPVNERNFESEVMASDVPVLVEFGATWCGPCKTVEPELRAFAQEIAPRAKVVQVDIDQSPTLAQTLGVRSVPTFVVFHGGRPVDGRQGVIRKADMLSMVERYLPRSEGALAAPEASKLLALGRIKMVDVREEPVFHRAHIQGAVNIPAAELETRLAELMTLGAYPVLYCRTGADSKALAEKLIPLGAEVAYLEGGVLAWETEGNKLERP